MLNSIEDIIELHESEGKIEDAYMDMHFDDKILKLNLYTLKFSTVNAEKEDTRRWNNRLNFELKKNRELYKEIKEFRVLFDAFTKLKIRDGYIKKSESPDFILERNGIKTGIEITKIYSGNDWAAEKLKEDIRTYGLKENEVEGYIEYKRFRQKIKTYKVKENLVITPINKCEEELKIKVKNKIFEKIRKMFDDYKNYPQNMILAEIKSSKYLDLENFNEELTFYVNHLEENFEGNEYLLLIKKENKWFKFDLKRHMCEEL